MTLWPHFRIAVNILRLIICKFTASGNREKRFSPTCHQNSVDPVKLRPKEETLEPGDQVWCRRMMLDVGCRLSLGWCGHGDWASLRYIWILWSDRKWWSRCVVALKIVAGGCWYSGQTLDIVLISTFHRLVVQWAKRVSGIGQSGRSLDMLPSMNMWTYLHILRWYGPFLEHFFNCTFTKSSDSWGHFLCHLHTDICTHIP